MGFFSKKAEEKQDKLKGAFDEIYKLGLYPKKAACPVCGSDKFLLMNYKATGTIGDLQRDIIDERFLGPNTGVCKHCGIILFGKVYFSEKNEDVCFTYLNTAIVDLYIIHKKVRYIYDNNSGDDKKAQDLGQLEFDNFMENRKKEDALYYNDMKLPDFVNSCFAFRYSIH